MKCNLIYFGNIYKLNAFFVETLNGCRIQQISFKKLKNHAEGITIPKYRAKFHLDIKFIEPIT
jgi:hypothetical protein